MEGHPREGFRPWRELVTPHPDVSSGPYQEAEFAADLGQVYRGEGSDEYRDPVQFYRRTHITDGLHRLLVNALRRLGGEGGDPVVELQTNFGGGNTHSMLALYHLFSADRAIWWASSRCWRRPRSSRCRGSASPCSWARRSRPARPTRRSERRGALRGGRAVPGADRRVAGALSYFHGMKVRRNMYPSALKMASVANQPAKNPVRSCPTFRAAVCGFGAE